ncbi:DUF2577 family protein [Clostridium oceanicum]|uniref:DUF2577 domain-containing protein n=1 Tax=Clostridium oceanicum TaxID=1543 RepID=A0ABP3UIZ4_9CLOT
MSYDIDFAKWLKERNNKENIGVIKGKVVEGGRDYIISILDNQVYLDRTNSTLCNSLKDRVENRNIQLNDNIYNAKITYNNMLNVEDEVLVIANQSNNYFYIIDKIGGS